MVSKRQCYLSFLLLVGITTSYFWSPTVVQAQGFGNTDPGVFKDVPPDALAKARQAAGYCPEGNIADATKEIFNYKDSEGGRIVLDSLPPYGHRCFKFDESGNLIHIFSYDLNPQIAGKLYQQKYTKATTTNAGQRIDIPVYAGCKQDLSSTLGNSAPCNSKTPLRFNFFTFFTAGKAFDLSSTRPAGEFGDSATESTIGETYPDQQAELYFFADQLDSGEPNAFLIVLKKQFVYGFYTMNDDQLRALKRMTAEERTAFRNKQVADGQEHYDLTFRQPGHPDDYKRATWSSTFGRPENTRPIFHYIANVNGLANTDQTRPPYNVENPIQSITDKKERTQVTKIGVDAVFGAVTSTDITLVDDTENSSDSQFPDKPPKLKISSSGTHLTDSLTFTLRHVLRVSGGIAKNNYFLFKIDNPEDGTSDVPLHLWNELSKQGVDPDLFYVAVDMAGNVGFIVDDPSINGGIFGAEKDRLDKFVVVHDAKDPEASPFDSSDPNKAKNRVGKPITLRVRENGAIAANTQYHDIITQRVYNEPGEGSTICGAIINYKETNTKYIPPTYEDSIPDAGHRECINVSEGSWLKKWDVSDTKLDKSEDPCISAFDNAGPFAQFLIARPLCNVIQFSVGMATWFAGFSVDFMVKAIGLQ